MAAGPYAGRGCVSQFIHRPDEEPDLSPRIELPRVHHVVPLNRQEVRAEPVRAGPADRSHSRQVERGMSRGPLHT